MRNPDASLFESLCDGPPPPVPDGFVLTELHCTEDAQPHHIAGFYLETAAQSMRRGTMRFVAVAKRIRSVITTGSDGVQATPVIVDVQLFERVAVGDGQGYRWIDRVPDFRYH